MVLGIPALVLAILHQVTTSTVPTVFRDYLLYHATEFRLSLTSPPLPPYVLWPSRAVGSGRSTKWPVPCMMLHSTGFIIAIPLPDVKLHDLSVAALSASSRKYFQFFGYVIGLIQLNPFSETCRMQHLVHVRSSSYRCIGGFASGIAHLSLSKSIAGNAHNLCVSTMLRSSSSESGL